VRNIIDSLRIGRYNLSWAAIRQDQLMENWELAQRRQELFAIEPLK